MRVFHRARPDENDRPTAELLQDWEEGTPVEVVRGPRQLALTEPDVLVKKRRMTKRQSQVAFFFAVNSPREFRAKWVGKEFGYRHPGAALAILVERGQLERVRRGVYRHHAVIEALTEDALP